MNPDIDRIYRQEAPHIRATLIRLLGSFELADEATQMAFLAAASQWTKDGVPKNPRAWLVSTGRFRMIDHLRRRARFSELVPDIAYGMEVASMKDEEEADMLEDDMLRLIFTCCHPDLPPDAQAAMCLREVCGLTTEAIAAAFLTKPATIAQRIVRAKTRIRTERIPYIVPEGNELAERLDLVLRVIYLVYSEGYAASSGESLVRDDLCQEAIRLAKLLRGLMDSPDIDGLLGLLLLQNSRKAARFDATGESIPLSEQDRSGWNIAEIEEGRRLVRHALARPPLATYTIQGSIADIHAAALTTGQIDWAAIVRAYDLLLIADPGPIVALNRAIALGMYLGPEAGLRGVDEILEGPLAGYKYARLARADFLRQLGRTEPARLEYQAVLATDPPDPERRFIERRLRELDAMRSSTTTDP